MISQSFAQDRIITGDTTRLRFLPTAIRFGPDLITVAKNFTNQNFSGFELNIDADTYRRFYPALDIGRWKNTIDLGNGTYNTDGNYFKLGVDVNFLLKDLDRNMFFVGLRYGHSSYNDNVTFTSNDPYFGSVSHSYANSGTRGNWKELTAGVRVKIYKFIWLGMTGRVKLGLNVKGEDVLKTYEVPGYGLTFKNTWYGFNYQILFRIPVRRDAYAAD